MDRTGRWGREGSCVQSVHDLCYYRREFIGTKPISSLAVDLKCLLPAFYIYICSAGQRFTIGYGVTANIAASHAAARGSIPRIRVRFLFVSYFRCGLSSHPPSQTRTSATLLWEPSLWIHGCMALNLFSITITLDVTAVIPLHSHYDRTPLGRPPKEGIKGRVGRFQRPLHLTISFDQTTSSIHNGESLDSLKTVHQ